jgi:hypothetical protein
MWTEDYFQYKDWELKLKEVYDNFNLLFTPLDRTKDLFYHDKEGRVVPQGIVPHPKIKRVVEKGAYKVVAPKGGDLIT